ncbi:hypothetical protein [Vampirovibrio chlorellavorus]|uniref:hypothetical protein n=1 Tax=Vampirovibrio chlorellavorus TaxID=758823 RepID=UPI0026F09C11|nr:hypothetical protein [Vampirovibrio chlorellavorus]
MSLLDEPIDLPSTEELLSVPVLAGAGFGLFAAYSVFKTPSLAQMLGLSMLGGLGGFYLNPVLVSGPPAPRTPNPAPSPVPAVPEIRVPSLPTLDFGGFFQGALDTVQDAIENVLPPTTADTGGKPVTIAPGSIMNPETAYALIQQGKYATHVRYAKMSRYYQWKDCIEPLLAPVGASRAKQVALETLKNSAKLASYLDIVCDRSTKSKITANSWIRIQQKSSFHTSGKAADLGGSLTFEYITGPLLRAARSVQGINIGIPTVRNHRSLHIDIGFRAGSPAGKPQFTFIDNGSYGGGDKWNEILPPPGGSQKPVVKTTAKASILPKAGSIAVPTAPKPRPLPFIPIPVFAPAPAPPAYGPGDVSGSIIRYN